MIRARLLVAMALVGLVAWPASAQREPNVHALTGAKIVTAPGKSLESGTLIIRDGLIEAVGAEVKVPAEAKVWDLEGATLYPGLIESFRAVPWPSSEAEDDDEGSGDESPMVNPERDMLHHADQPEVFDKLRQAGFTTAILAPTGGLFRGQSVLLNLGDNGIERQILQRGVAQNAEPAINGGGGYPNSLMGSIALFRQTMSDASWHGAAHRAFSRNPKQARPEYNAAWAALEAVAEKKQPIVLESRDPLNAFRLAELVEEFNLDAVLVGSGREYQTLDQSLALGLPWIIPVQFPKAPKVDPDHPEKADLSELRHWDLAPTNLQKMLDGGAKVAVTSHGLADPKKIHENLARAVERGLDPSRALAALTTVPAAMWGLSDRAGTLEPGKMANLVVADGELFTKEVRLRGVWVDGHYVELKEIEPPTVDPIGSWDILIDAGPGGQFPATVVFTGTAEEMDGEVKSPEGSLPMLDAVTSGDTVEFSIDSTPLGMPGTISFTLTIDGETLSGTGMSPQGPFTVSGNLIDRPDGEEGR